VDSEHGQFHVLRRHFFREFLDNDLLSPDGDQHGGLVMAAAALIIPGVLLPGIELFKYSYPFWTAVERDVRSWSDKCLFVTLSMIALAGLAVVNWDALRPNRRDQMVLGPLPVRAATILQAKLAAFGLLLTVFAAAVTGATPVTFTFVRFAPAPIGFSEALRWMGAHTVASLGAAAFGFTAVLALQGLLLLAVGPKRFTRVGAWFQFGLVFALAVAFLLLPLVMGSAEPMKTSGSPLMFWIPPMWFLGLYQWLGGAGDPAWSALARLAVVGVAASTVVAISTQVVGYRVHVTRLLESQTSARRAAGPLKAAGSALADLLSFRRPVERAVFAFTVQTLTRSPRHRLVIAASLAAGCSLGAIGLFASTLERGQWEQPNLEMMLSVQLLLGFCATFGVRIAAAMPSDLRANWVFRLLDPGNPGPWMRGFRRAVLWCGLVPLVLLQLPLNAWWMGWRVASAHAVVGVLLAATIMEIMFTGYRKVPFACSYVAGGGPPKARWAFYWLGFTLYSYSLAAVEARALGSVTGYCWFLGVGIAALLGLILYRNHRHNDGFAPQFDAESDWDVQTLNLTA
jgi:hypothetical protein